MNKENFIIILIVIFVIFYTLKINETFNTNTKDITSNIIIDNNIKSNIISKYPYYPNNLETPPEYIKNQIEELQKYQNEYDGLTKSILENKNNIELNRINKIKNIDNLENLEKNDKIEGFSELEGFSMMNPYISN
jgi:hypothetical protein